MAALATAHGWTGDSWRERRLYYPFDKRLLARFPRVVAVSSDIKRVLEAHGARPERVTVLLNAIDPSTFRRRTDRVSGSRRALGYAAGEIVIGSVGRLERQKRFDLLLEAFARVSAKEPRARLAIAGDGALREELASLSARLGLAGRCQFLGHRTDVVELHHAFDLFVQSSDYEGTPNAVLEAMAMETPLVATDVGGTRELALPDVHGIVIPAGDVEALASSMLRALREPATARQRALLARRRIEDDLSFAARTRRLEAIYEELAGRDAGPARGAAPRTLTEDAESPSSSTARA